MKVGGRGHAPTALPPRKTRYSLYRKLRRLQGRSLYPLRYPGPQNWHSISLIRGTYNNNIIKSIVPSRNIGCLWVLSTSVYRLLRTLVHSSFYPLPWLPIFSSCFSVFLSSSFPEDSKVGNRRYFLYVFMSPVCWIFVLYIYSYLFSLYPILCGW